MVPQGVQRAGSLLAAPETVAPTDPRGVGFAALPSAALLFGTGLVDLLSALAFAATSAPLGDPNLVGEGDLDGAMRVVGIDVVVAVALAGVATVATVGRGTDPFAD